MTTAVAAALRLHVHGVVQGVGFRPYVWRLARAHALRGWVRNDGDGVRIHIEGAVTSVESFVGELRSDPPAAATIVRVDVSPADAESADDFEIIGSASGGDRRTRISPDLPVCDACLLEMRDSTDRRHCYPYINCTNCGPRYSILRELPYDRARTTMAAWPLCAACDAEYGDPGDRRFHAQPTACLACGPHYALRTGTAPPIRGDDAIHVAALMLRAGAILAIKGIGGYHLACDAENETAVAALRARKFRKEQPFAVMTRDLAVARQTVDVTTDVETLLRSSVRPIVLASARLTLPGVAPDRHDLGVMLPYAPLHHLLFGAGAPCRLVMTSGNRSSEPIAFDDNDALARLAGIADAFLMGERPIARRVDDSVLRAGIGGPLVLRRSRGMAPAAVATLPASRPILALGGDLKNTVTLVVDGEAFASQHIGDLSHHASLRAFDETIRDLIAMYGVSPHDLTVVHDAHPQYASTTHAATLCAAHTVAVQHHRAHVASVLAERGALETRVAALVCDGTGYGDNGTIWGGEVFIGSVAQGFERVAHLRPAMMPGGDAAARNPVQAAAGFLAQLDDCADVMRPPFVFPQRYLLAREIMRGGLRTFETTSTGRLFDAVAALIGFTRGVTFEGQAAMWLEYLACAAADDSTRFDIVFDEREIDWRTTLEEVIDARRHGVPPEVIARAFHRTLAHGLASAVRAAAHANDLTTIVLSGGVVQNQLLVADIRDALAASSFEIWINREVPPNDGGLSLGQAAIAAAQPRC